MPRCSQHLMATFWSLRYDSSPPAFTSDPNFKKKQCLVVVISWCPLKCLFCLDSTGCWGCCRCWFIPCRCCCRSKTCIWGCWYNGSSTFCLHVAWASDIWSFRSYTNWAWPWNCKSSWHQQLFSYSMEENMQLMYWDLVISVCGFVFALNIPDCCKIHIFFPNNKHLFFFPAWRTWCCCCWAPVSWCSGWTCS
jgi:hypothetical protein